MGHIDLRRFPDPASLARHAAADWLEAIAALSSAQQVVCVALAGGRIAQTFLSAIAQQLQPGDASLKRVHFFWSDERCVGPDDPESNFRLANEALFRPLALPQNQLHRVRGEQPPAEACAAAETEVRAWAASGADGQPRLDLVLLGTGEDGHVASLFPGEPQDVMNSTAVYRSVRAVKPPPLRITMGYRVLVAAAQVWVLASGAGKQAALRQSLDPQGGTPLARVFKLRDSTRLYSDIPG